MGNTCYLNSVLQILSNIPKFREYFISKEYYNQMLTYVKKNYCDIDNINNESEIALFIPLTISYQFERLFKAIWSNNDEIQTYRPQTFRRLIGSKYENFNNYVQQDAHECIMAIFNIIEQEIGYSVEVEPEYTHKEFITFSVLDQGFEELESLKKDFNAYVNKRVDIRLLEDNYPGLIKRYRQLQYLTKKYSKAYSICDELFCSGQIDCLECSNCNYKSYNYSDNYCIFAEIPENLITENDIQETMKTIVFPFECQQNNIHKIRQRHLFNDNIEDLDNIVSDSDSINAQPSSVKSDLNLNSDSDLDMNFDKDDFDKDDFDCFLDSDTDDDNTLKRNKKSVSFVNAKNDSFLKPKPNPQLNIPPQILEQIRRTRAIDKLSETKVFTLQSCLDLTFKTEQLDFQMTCNFCDTKCNMTKTNKLWNIPKYLIIQLKRFDMMTETKKTNLIEFDETIDIGKYMDEDLPDNLKISTKYNLIGVINHSGGMSGGHYYTFAKNTTTNLWFNFNDESINQIKSPVTPAAYILVYENC